MRLSSASFTNLTVRQKLVIFTLCISTLSLLLFMSGLAAQQYANERSHVAESHGTLAAVVASSVAAALTFEDRKVAADTLHRLQDVPSVDFATIYDERGVTFQTYSRSGNVAEEMPSGFFNGLSDGPTFSSGGLFIVAPIIADSKIIGRVVLSVNLTAQWRRLYDGLLLAVFLTGLLTGAVYVLSNVAAKFLTKPIDKLGAVMRRISESQDYCERFENPGTDEIGQLGHGFNAMLERIQDRDAELGRYRLSLEELVHERTQQLNERNRALTDEIRRRAEIQDDLVAAKELAEQASVAKSEFLANISHEIRTPLNAVIGITDLLSRGSLTERQVRFVTSIRHAGRSLLTLINDILDFSKAEAGGVTLREEEVSLRRLAEETIAVLGETAIRKGLDLVPQVDGNVPDVVRTDGGRVRQVLINLLNNAIKFTEKGRVELKISFKRISKDGGAASVVISDTGVGIAEKDQERIFHAFEQVDASSTRNFGGTGLGLAITRKLIEAMDGTIRLESRLGAGSVFTVIIPMAIAESKVVGSRDVQDVFSSVPVLVVDGDLNQSSALEAFTSAWGMMPEMVSSAGSAIAMLRKAAAAGKPFSLFICDLKCSDMTGVELISRVRAEPAISGTPAILVCSSPDRGIVPNTLRDSSLAVLTSPVSQSGLHNTIRDLLISYRKPSDRTDQRRAHVLPQYRLEILVAEDNAVNQEVAVENLSSLGCRVDSAGDGVGAGVAFQKKKYDLILMDCQMPKLDGFGATRQIRQIEKERQESSLVPIVALTAHALAGDRENCLKEGMSDYITKPFGVEDLINCLSRWCPSSNEISLQASRIEVDIATSDAIPSPPFNENYADNLRTAKPELWRRLKAAFLAQAGAARRAVPLALESRDFATMRLIAHTFKSAAANVGASNLSEISRRLEEAAIAEDFSTCSEHCAVFAAATALVCKAMEDEDVLGKAAGGVE